jgi:cytochrome c oxidase subunit II
LNIPSSIITLLVGIGLTIISLWYGQNNHLMPVAASNEATQVDGLFQLMLTIGTGLFVLVQGILIYVMIKFRRRPEDNQDGPPIHGNIPLEILWTSIPAVVVLGIGIYSFEVYNSMGGLDPMASGSQVAMHSHHHRKGAAIAAPLSASSDQNPMSDQSMLKGRTIALGIGASPENEGKTAQVVVNVTGLQYAWVFNYADSGITSGELHLPVGQDAQLNISATDVLHAFWLPQFRIKQDAIPGMPTELRFTPRKVGQYPIVCAELCGGYHGSMRTTLIVETPEEYQNWITSQQEVASQDHLQDAIALNPRKMSEGQYLAPYATEMGINANTLKQLEKGNR